MAKNSGNKSFRKFTSSSGQSQTGLTRNAQALLAGMVGTGGILTMLTVSILIPSPTPYQELTFRIILALFAAVFAVFIPGALSLMTMSGAIRAYGGMAIFLVVYLWNPAGSVKVAGRIPNPSATKESTLRKLDITTEAPSTSAAAPFTAADGKDKKGNEQGRNEWRQDKNLTQRDEHDNPPHDPTTAQTGRDPLAR